MKKDVIVTMVWMLVLLAALFGVFMLGRCSVDVTKEIIEKSDTVTVTDTITPDPVEVEREVVKWKCIPVTFRDTVTLNDTVIQIRDSVAIIPIALKTYTDSSTYKAVISGYDPRLESIEIYQQNTIITNTIKPRPWSVGLQGGVYMTPAGVQPGIGIGVSYRLSFSK